MSGKNVRILLLLICLSFGAAAYGQDNGAYGSFSPYSIYGIGNMSKEGTAYNRSMGGVGIANRSKRFINIMNPASLTARDSLSFMADFGLSESNTIYRQNLDGAKLRSGNNTFNIHDFVISFPIYRSSAFMVGITPFSDVGYGFSSNGTPVISQPSDEGCVRAMVRAMNDAGMTPDDIDYINAHATSTRQGDMFEAMAIDKLFHGKHALISSTKSMTGHECWMAGASEIVYSLIMMQNDFVAPNINLDEPDEYAAALNIARETIHTGINTVLSNSFGFGGTNSALVIRKI